MDYGNCQDNCRQFSWSKKASNYLHVKLKFVKKGDNKEIRLFHNLLLGEADFNQLMRLRNQPVIGAETESVAREKNLSPVLITTMSKDTDEHLKLAHEVFDVVDGANKKICVTLPQYIVDKPESFYLQVHFSARMKEDEKFLQFVYVNHYFEEFCYLPDVMISVYKKVITNQPLCNVLLKVNSSVLSSSFFFLFDSG